MRTTTGGNWKELVKAATEGDVALTQYHLNSSIDPNFQHPEFMTSPLHEAVKARQRGTVDVLLNYHETNRADPTIVGDWEGTTPMEEALGVGDHGIVDLLLRALPREGVSGCWTVWMTGVGVGGECRRRDWDLVLCLLGLGHCVVVTPVEGCDVDHRNWLEAMAEDLKVKTGNRKIWVCAESDLSGFFAGDGGGSEDSKVEWRPSMIDVWLARVSIASKNFTVDLANHVRHQESSGVSFREGIAKVMLLIDSGEFSFARGRGEGEGREQQVLERVMLGNKSAKFSCCAMVEPNPHSYWNRLTYNWFWGQTWCNDVTGRLLGMAAASKGGNKEDGANGYGGKIFLYNREEGMTFPPSLKGVDDSNIFDEEEWWKELDRIIPSKE